MFQRNNVTVKLNYNKHVTNRQTDRNIRITACIETQNNYSQDLFVKTKFRSLFLFLRRFETMTLISKYISDASLQRKEYTNILVAVSSL